MSAARRCSPWLALALFACGAPPVVGDGAGPPPGEAAVEADPTVEALDPAALQPLLDAAFDPRGPTLPTFGTGVRWADLSADGQRIVTASHDVAALWHADTGRLVALLVGDPARIPASRFPRQLTGVRFAADGRLVARAYSGPAGRDVGIDIWDGRTGLPVRAMQGPMRPVHDMAFSADNRALVSVHDDGIRIWDVATGARRPGPPSLRRPVADARLSPFGQTAWIAHRQPTTLALRRTRDGAVLADGDCAFDDVAFSTDGRLALCLGHRNRALDARTGAAVDVGDGGRACVAPDGATPDRPWVCLRRGKVVLTDPRSAAAIATIADVRAFSEAVPAGGRIVMGATAGKSVWPQTVRHHRPWTWVELPQPFTGRSPIRALAVGPGGRAAVMLSNRQRGARTVLSWTTDGDLAARWTLPYDGRVGLTFSPDGQRLLTHDGHVLTPGDEARRLPGVDRPDAMWRRFGFASDGTIVSIADAIDRWSGDGRALDASPLERNLHRRPLVHARRGRRALVTGRDVWSIDAVTGADARRIAETRVNALCEIGAVAPDGATALVHCGRSDPWRMVDTLDGRGLWTLDGEPKAFVFAGDGSAVAAVHDETRVFDAATGALRATVPSRSRVVALAPDGRWLAVGRRTGQVELWRLEPAPTRLVMPVFEAPVEHLAFTDDGRHLLIGGAALPQLVVMPFPLTRAVLRDVACANRPGWPTAGFDCGAAP